ncbi:MAG: hypothetical protein K2P23_11095 [Lachnospiraceae bacterium]|nr:hypothetical protein [Lachnospiraceae bacterium]
MYQKEIIYMGLFRHGMKEGNAGYLKAAQNGDAFRLELQVKNLPGAITGSFPIRLQSETGWREADMLVIKEGNGKWNGSAAEQILRVEIILSDAKRIKGESRFAAAEKAGENVLKSPEKPQPPVEKQEEEETAERRAAWSFVKQAEPKPTERNDIQSIARQREPGRTEQSGIPSDARQREPERPERSIISSDARKREPEQNSIQSIARQREPESMKQSGFIQAEHTPGRPEHTPLYENKWEQLLTTYERIHPYGDNRIYVKLEPKDFIVLRENYQHLVNNSFLLHGFYNYRYLILGKEKDFYLGVPGVFYEREKMVALMFGFEAFECEGGEAEEGKFGYYLRKVEL